ncbi:Zinc finger protein ZAT3 [Apostasia shenzhenica]|uniref:Zinc finger protein ZAT3 n=1 Tax=Apostasia shenzhenica TaxID=1088818 RepID=A0A2H9ZT46_9ASPA|nr:Zinc finger protein ZAT3 [Apostasia shenzhenica]
MALVMDRQRQQQQQQQKQSATHKHHCRICRKGFGCGRALGGHMRAHGINDEPVADSDDDQSGGDWEEREGRTAGSQRIMYSLRTNPNSQRTCRVCENCGREFCSWKSFLDHGRCSSGDEIDEPDEPSPPSSPLSDAAEDDGLAEWSKGKRSRRVKSSAALPPAATEEEDLANCLVMLSAARVDHVLVAETEESCASASKEDERIPPQPPPPPAVPAVPPVPKGMFECKACKKVFSSHQALGGHRASHKKVKGCFAAKLENFDDPSPEDDNNSSDMRPSSSAAAAASIAAMAMAIVPFVGNAHPLAEAPLKRKAKVHECSICHRQFASGQALGGHKRCHWITSNAAAETVRVAAKLQAVPEVGSSRGCRHHELTLRPMLDGVDTTLDLNMPAPADELAGVRRSIGSPLRLDAPAAIYIQPPWIHQKEEGSSFNDYKKIINVCKEEEEAEEDEEDNLEYEADSKTKMAKLSELKDMNEGEESSPWLQVGIGSSSAKGGGGDQN